MQQNTNDIGGLTEDPTEQEIATSVERVKSRYGVELSGEAATRYTKLRNQLRWYLIRDIISVDAEEPTDEDAQKVQSFMQEQMGTEVSLDDARKLAEMAPKYTAHYDKDKIAAEMAAIIDGLK